SEKFADVEKVADHREGHRRRAGYALRPRHLADDHGRDSRYSRANIQKAEPVSTGTNCSISAKTKVHSRDNRYTKREEPVTNHRLTARFVTGSSVLRLTGSSGFRFRSPTAARTGQREHRCWC